MHRYWKPITKHSGRALALIVFQPRSWGSCPSIDLSVLRVVLGDEPPFFPIPSKFRANCHYCQDIHVSATRDVSGAPGQRHTERAVFLTSSSKNTMPPSEIKNEASGEYGLVLRPDMLLGQPTIFRV
ncbi:hypothetical protein CC2G_013043 [Coprinopsis cinerea AmutBmut pab1-1]|nr:hypothetical protein CC2G_013043 [Coprinopsis cinerea AmutBmut pab1-1]